MSTTPTAALELLLDLPPLHVTIKKEAKQATHSYQTNEIRINGASQKTIVDEILYDKTVGILQTDNHSKTYNFKNYFLIHLS